jgi:hypothetical protein
MPILDVNWDEVPDKIPPIAPGIYEGTLDIIPEMDEQSSAGNPMFVIDLRITRALAPEGENYIGQTLRDWIMKGTLRGQSRLKNFCSSCGKSPNVEWSDLVGETFTFRVKNSTDKEGELRASIAEYKPQS